MSAPPAPQTSDAISEKEAGDGGLWKLSQTLGSCTGHWTSKTLPEERI